MLVNIYHSKLSLQVFGAWHIKFHVINVCLNLTNKIIIIFVDIPRHYGFVIYTNVFKAIF